MRGLVFSLSQLSSILLVSLIVLSTQLLWAQGKSSVEASPANLLDAPSHLASVAKARTHLFFADSGLPLSFKQTRGETQSGIRFFVPYNAGDYRLPSNTEAALSQAARTALRDQEKHPISSVPRWLTFAPINGKVHHETIYSIDQPEYYAQHIPWAGSLIVRICQQAEVHPRVTRVLKVFRPQF